MRTKRVPVKSCVPFVAMAFALSPLSTAAQSIEQKIDALQQEVERLKQESRARKEPAAPAAASDSTTSIFGYGEFNYNRFRDSDRTSKGCSSFLSASSTKRTNRPPTMAWSATRWRRASSRPPGASSDSASTD